MFTITKLQRQSLHTLSSLLCSNVSKDGSVLGERCQNLLYRNPVLLSSTSANSKFDLNGGLSSARWMSSKRRARTVGSRVEMRMLRESGQTIREVRQAKQLKLNLMNAEERLIHQHRKAKKKEALLLRMLKRYEPPEVPWPKHDPELLTPEQIQAYRKLGLKNKNYAILGIRGVFGGVIQNMHLHWKYHETVQVCCYTHPKEKIREIASMIARLSGGIVVDIHKWTTIIMYRGRNYRQPKYLIPFNSLTGRKALFKGRFEQALRCQRLNIEKCEQELRQRGVNPEDPAATASIQNLASTFFNENDELEESPCVFRAIEDSKAEPQKSLERLELEEDSDYEELDQFISKIVDAAEKEWLAEEAAEKEVFERIRYLNRDGGRFGRSEGDYCMRSFGYEDHLMDGSEESASDEEKPSGRVSRPGREMAGYDHDSDEPLSSAGENDEVEGDLEFGTWHSDDLESSVLDAVEDDYKSSFDDASFGNTEDDDRKEEEVAQRNDEGW